ncbi:MAG: hypothetical protein NTX15_05970 [Candidatus Kapabacteria bacterium]|nr:hypothetical protein [Candidatus Kapabacteria bacterium]
MRSILWILSGILFFSSVLVTSAGDKPELQGYCPVAYVALHKAVKGDQKFVSTFKGHKYLFVNADAKMAFDKEPSKFVKNVPYDGWCATGIAMGKKIVANPELLTVVNDKVYLFSTNEAKKAFDMDQPKNIVKADAYYASLTK